MSIVFNIRLEVEEEFHEVILDIQHYLTKRLGRKPSKASLILEFCKIKWREKIEVQNTLLEHFYDADTFPLGYYGRNIRWSRKKEALDMIEADISSRESSISEREIELNAKEKALIFDNKRLMDLQFKVHELKLKNNSLEAEISRLKDDLSSKGGDLQKLREVNRELKRNRFSHI